MRTVPGRSDRVVVIGAGLGGLSAALHLAATGREVTVLERADRPGGRCGYAEIAGFGIDTGPSVLTMPEVIEATFAAVGESMADWLTLRRLDPAYRAHFADGSTIDVLSDRDAMTDQINSICGPVDAAGFTRFTGWLESLYRVQFDDFIDRNLDSVANLRPSAIARLAGLGGFRRLGPKVASFLPDERLQRLFSFQAMYAGIAPADALALYAVITYLDSVEGVFFPDGGMQALPAALAAAATKHGVRFRYATTAELIEVAGDRAVAVRTSDGERIAADVVVVNADRPTAIAQLLTAERRPRRLRYSPSCVLVHVSSPVAAGAHHEISFGTAWDATFAEIIEAGRVMSDPSFLISTPTFTDASLAPAGRQLRQVLFPAPNLAFDHPIDWTDTGPAYVDHLLSTVEARGFGPVDGPPLLVRTPADWLAAGMAGGTPFAAAHTFTQTGPLRASTLDRRIENLLWCGSNVQPGVGVPMALISGQLAAQRLR